MRAFGKTNVIGRKDMYPYYIIGDIDLYSIFIMLGIIAAVIVYRLCADRANINAKLYNFTLICALCSIVSGFVFSVLSKYNVYIIYISYLTGICSFFRQQPIYISFSNLN